MSDPFCLLCNILGLVETVAKARNYIQNLRDAPKDHKRLSDEINNLDTLIRKLYGMIESGPAPGADTVLEFEEPLNQLKTTMEQLVKKLDLDGVGKFTGRAKWSMWGKNDVQQALEAVERYKNLLNAWLALDIWFDHRSLSVSTANNPQECNPR
ncbi:putative ankyrin [Mycena venus]|uniref:Putative ankyrin n=1 Tax=Mycena venus TaxID=2733690 RepID=A0A8H6YQL3_9AGAR|nr:putative ankyrin [Mycena venus]